MKALIAIVVFSLTLFVSADDTTLDGIPYEDCYSFSWEMPGDGGEGGGMHLVRFLGDDIYSEEAIVPAKTSVGRFFWKFFGLARGHYTESLRNTAKYSISKAVLLQDIYKYETVDGEVYLSEDIFFYFIDKAAMASYQNSERVSGGDSLLPFAFSLDDLYAFEDDQGNIIRRRDIKTIYYRKH